MSEFNNSTTQQESESSVSLRDLWNLVWGHKYYLLGFVVICLLFAGFYIYKTPSVYVRSAKVIIDETQKETTAKLLTQGVGNVRGLGSGTTVMNEIEAISSPDLIETIVRRNGMSTRYVEHQFLRNRESYGNTPFRLSLEGDNRL